MEDLQQLLAQGNLTAAEAVCRKAIRQNKNDPNMLALLGAILLKTGQLEESEQQLRKVIKLAPQFAKAYDDLGVLLMRKKDFQEAEKMFREAVTLLPNLGSSWYGLVHALQGQGNLAEAKRICSMILNANSGDFNAIRLMASIAADEGDVLEAGRLLQSIIDKNPSSVMAVVDLARFSAEQHQYARAIELYERAVQLEPGNSKHQFALGRYLFTVGDAAKALDAYQSGLKLDPTSAEGISGRLYALRTVGRSEEVIAGYRECIEKGVNVCESWWGLSSLRTYKFSDADVNAMMTMRNSAEIGDLDAQYLDFAIGKALDDQHQFDEAWKHYSSGNKSRSKTLVFDDAAFRTKVDSVISAIDATQLARGKSVEHQSVTPIFILGMPRSGSTLIEQILASHSAVEATTELPYMTGLAERCLFSEGTTPQDAIASRSTDDLAAIGNSYLKATELHRQQSKPCFIDKEPDNFLYAGLIAMILPHAKIIDARRNPMDTCVGNFRQWFATGKEFSYDLDKLASYYLQYRRIMQHWDDIMPGKIIRVDYENVVNETEQEVRRILAACDLPWQEDCLRFYESERQVTTASSEQVRQPVYKSALEFWKHYETHLGSLKDALASVRE